ncbi:hypothetical protein D3C75_1161490 [compost metagenome]
MVHILLDRFGSAGVQLEAFELHLYVIPVGKLLQGSLQTLFSYIAEGAGKIRPNFDFHGEGSFRLVM